MLGLFGSSTGVKKQPIAIEADRTSLETTEVAFEVAQVDFRAAFGRVHDGSSLS